ncbi:SDR family NAD(P)-dependent oxidoreductase [Verrucomicrobium spinosum]|uniref:SDR family NAD(P)-dependent oxidoreductase n=1 Tax=Verrucomicrobium spinosum TaxID=2736 RepID=UPI000174582E|nr:SDR family oxidoreductase [Verrucomicrobium spinosum]
MLPFSLTGQTAIVTGGGTGLGLGITRCLVQAGARVVITGRRPDVLQDGAAQLGDAVVPMVVDVTDTKVLPDFVREVEAKIGTPSILVNNAGVHVKKPALEMTDEDFDSVLRTHLTGAFALTRAVAPGMLAQQRGSLVFVSSMTAYMGMPLVTGYATAKTGVIGMVRTLSAEFAPKGVRVNAVAPGWIDTPMLRKAISADAERERKIRGRIQIEGFGAPEDVGWAVVYLCSEAARYVTGVILPIDGGGHASF